MCSTHNQKDVDEEQKEASNSGGGREAEMWSFPPRAASARAAPRMPPCWPHLASSAPGTHLLQLQRQPQTPLGCLEGQEVSKLQHVPCECSTPLGWLCVNQSHLQKRWIIFLKPKITEGYIIRHLSEV